MPTAWRAAFLISCLAALAAPTAAQTEAASAVVRVACEGPATGAAVTVNGVFKGECPVDVPVVAGVVRLRVVQPVGATRERVFEQELRMAAQTAKRVDVVLGEPQLNAAGMREEAEKQARQKEQAARELVQRRNNELALVARANAGEVPAMLEVAHWIARTEYASWPEGAQLRMDYDNAKTKAAASPPADPVLAAWYRGSEYWYRKVTEAGDSAVGFFLRPNWHYAPGWVVNLMRGLVNQPMPPVREVNAVGLPAITALVDSDPFFRIGDAKGRWTGNYTWSKDVESRELSCKRESGQVVRIEGVRRVRDGNSTRDFSIDHTAALGGLLTLTFSDTRLLNRTKWQLHSIESVYGQPLPLGSRFGIRFKRDAAGPVMHLHCTSFETTDPVTKESSKTGAICFQTDGTTSHVNASRWHVPSACFAQVPLVWEQP